MPAEAKKASDSPELELQEGVDHSYDVGARNPIGPLEEQQVPLTVEPSLQLLHFSFSRTDKLPKETKATLLLFEVYNVFNACKYVHHVSVWCLWIHWH